jgi:predicted ATPase
LWGWALAQQGQGEAGIAQIRQGLTTYQATGAGLDQPHMLALLTEAYETMGQIEERLGAVSEGLAVAHKTGEDYYKAELHRLQGELLLAQGESAAVAEAEARFQRAIEVARRQSAKWLELRAVMSLCRLWHSLRSPDKRTQAHLMLAEIYG